MILFFILMLVTSFANAVSTETHTYILDKGTLNILDHETGLETELKLGECSSNLKIHHNKGYCMQPVANTVTVIDLKTHTIESVIPVGNRPWDQAFYGSYGYIISLTSHTLSVIDLKTNKVIRTHEIGKSPNKIVSHQRFGYILDSLSPIIHVIDLETGALQKSIECDNSPRDMVFYDGKAYIASYNRIHIVCLKTHTILETILTDNPNLIFGLTIFKDRLYINVHSTPVFIFDLKTQKQIEVPFIPGFSAVHFHENRGYFFCSEEIYILNLDALRTKKIANGTLHEDFGYYQLCVIGHKGYYKRSHEICIYCLDFNDNVIEYVRDTNGTEGEFHFSPTHLYWNTKKICLHNVNYTPKICALLLSQGHLKDLASWARSAQLDQSAKLQDHAVYTDPLSIDELGAYFADQDPSLICLGILSLYQPLAFIKSVHGRTIVESLYSKLIELYDIDGRNTDTDLIEFLLSINDPFAMKLIKA